MIDEAGNKTSYGYDALKLEYDLVGNIISETGGEGHTKQYKYDKVNRLSAVADELGNTTGYSYI